MKVIQIHKISYIKSLFACFSCLLSYFQVSATEPTVEERESNTSQELSKKTEEVVNQPRPMLFDFAAQSHHTADSLVKELHEAPENQINEVRQHVFEQCILTVRQQAIKLGHLQDKVDKFDLSERQLKKNAMGIARNAIKGKQWDMKIKQLKQELYQSKLETPKFDKKILQFDQETQQMEHKLRLIVKLISERNPELAKQLMEIIQ